MGQSYCDLIVWQKAMKLAAEIYQITDGFPGKEIYGLTSQIRRAAVSVPSNIAEGQGRLTHKEFRHFLGNARGSLLELETQVRIAVDLKYLGAPAGGQILKQSTEVGRILNGLILSMSESESPKATHA